jgi:hypothetical protein
MAKPRPKYHISITENALPENMGTNHFGEFWLARDSGQVYFVSANGVLVNLSEIFLSAKPVCPPRHGRDGKDGIIGPRGVTGADSKVPGPKGDKGEKGDTIKGDKGDRGESIKGDKGDPGPDSQTVLADTRAALETLRQQVADIALQCKALRDMNVRSGEYVEFLKSRVAARLKKS